MTGRYSRFEGGSITWHANGSRANGVYEVHGAVFNKWASMGYGASVMGFPISDEGAAAPSAVTGATGRYNRFEGGSITWHASGPRANSTYEVHGAVFNKWASMGYGASALGFPISDEQGSVPSKVTGATSRNGAFEGGWVLWHASGALKDRAFAITGAIARKWATLGYGGSDLGLPTDDERDAGRSGATGVTGRYQRMEGGSLQAHTSGPRAGQAYEVHGAIYSKWGALGYGSSKLGFPISDEGESYVSSRTGATSRFSRFEGGSITWHRTGNLANKSFAVWGPHFSRWAEMGYGNGLLGLPISDVRSYVAFSRCDFEGGYTLSIPGFGTTVRITGVQVSDQIVDFLDRKANKLKARFPNSQQRLLTVLDGYRGRQLTEREKTNLQKLAAIETQAEFAESEMSIIEDALRSGSSMFADVVGVAAGAAAPAQKEYAKAFIAAQFQSISYSTADFAVKQLSGVAESTVSGVVSDMGLGMMRDCGSAFRPIGDQQIDAILLNAVELARTSNSPITSDQVWARSTQFNNFMAAAVDQTVKTFYRDDHAADVPILGYPFLVDKWVMVNELTRMLWCRNGIPGMLQATVLYAYQPSTGAYSTSAMANASAASYPEATPIRSDRLAVRVEGKGSLLIRDTRGNVYGYEPVAAVEHTATSSVVTTQTLSTKYVVVPVLQDDTLTISVIPMSSSTCTYAVELARITDVTRSKVLYKATGTAPRSFNIQVAKDAVSISGTPGSNLKTQWVTVSGSTVPIIPLARCTIWTRRPGTTTWSQSGTVLADDFGRYSRTLYVSSARYVRVSAAVPSDTVSWSSTRLLKPKVVLAVPATPSVVKRGTRFMVYGGIYPAHSARGSVKLQIQRKVGSTWVPWTTANASFVKLSRGSRYAARIAPPYPGSWRMRAYHPADALHASTVTGWRGFQVR